MPITDKEHLIKKPLVHLLLIITLGLLAYSNTFQSPFQWDEAVYIVDKPFVKDLTYFMEPSRAEGQDGAALKSRYIGYLTFALNYKLHGFKVFGYHVVNLAIHLINAILVYFLVLLTFRTPYFKSEKPEVSSKKEELATHYSPITTSYSLFTVHYSHLFALVVAILFVSHPIQTEAVTYVFQRFASLVSMFYLMSLVLYIKGRLSTGSHQQSAEDSGFTTHNSRFAIIWYLLSLLAAVLAMKTKENAFTLPVIITLYEFLFFTGPVKTRLLRLLPFLLTMLIIPITIMGTNSTAGEIISQVKDPASLGNPDVSRSEYIFTQFRVVVTYIRLLFLPVNQNLYYNYPAYQSFFKPPVFSSFLFLTVIFVLALYLVYKSRSRSQGNKRGLIAPTGHASRFTFYRLIAFGVFWFFITLSVESSIIPIPMLIDEYRVYLPSVGFFLAVMSGATLLLQRFKGRSNQYAVSSKQPAFNFLILTSCFLVVLALASATYARNALWKNKISLWEDVVGKSPRFPLGYNNLGTAYYEEGLYEKAIATYERAIALFPVYLDAYINLGVAYSAAGRPDMAIGTYNRAIAMYPKNGALYFNLAHTYATTGQPEKAVENYLSAIQLDPYNSRAYHGLGTVYARLGRFDDSIRTYTKFVELSPDDPEAFRNRGIVYEVMADLGKAQADFQKACSLGSRESCEYLEKRR